MTAENLFNVVMNNRPDYDLVLSCIRTLRSTLDRVANRTAKENAEWHDDPSADDHVEFHAPADKQFPREVRDSAIRELVRYHLAEMACQEKASK